MIDALHGFTSTPRQSRVFACINISRSGSIDVRRMPNTIRADIHTWVQVPVEPAHHPENHLFCHFPVHKP